jgi:type I restriction enzyme S subunit
MELRAGYKQTVVGVIPNDWDVQKLGDITDPKRPICYGIVQTGPTVMDGIRCLRVLDINNGLINKFGLITTSRKISDSYKRTILVKGDLVMPLRGKVGDVGLIDDDLEGSNLTRGVALIAVRSALRPQFIRQLISWSETRKRLEQTMNGSALQEIPIAALRLFSIGVPSSASEQQAIANALIDVDDLITSLDRLIAKKRDIKQAAMQQLLTGKTRLKGFSGEWETKRLGDVADLNKQHITPATSPNEHFVHFSLPAFDADKAAVVELGYQIGSNKFRVPNGAVLVSKLNPRIPRIWAPEHITLNSVCSTEFLVLTPKCNIMRSYLTAICQSQQVCESMELAATGTTGSHQRINANVAMSIIVYVPRDLAEQEAISNVIKDLDGELTKLAHRRDKTIALKQGMMQELLTGRTRLI